jgi:hypothetical protein
VRFVHVLSAMVWVGGQLLLSLLVLPVLRRRLDATSRAPLTREAVVLLISGVHGVAVGRGQDRLARLLAIATPARFGRGRPGHCPRPLRGGSAQLVVAGRCWRSRRAASRTIQAKPAMIMERWRRPPGALASAPAWSSPLTTAVAR